MADMESVLKGLECCTGDNSIETPGREHLCKMCPYHNANFHYCFNRIVLMKDAFELLKEQQEAVTSFQGTISRLNNALQEQTVQKCGHWIRVEAGFTDMKCSECGELALLDIDRDFVQSKYCPSCGAKMDEASGAAG